MDSFNLIASWTGWPFIVAVLLAAGGYALWLQKNRIDHLKESNDSLKQKFSPSEVQALLPDVYGIRILSPGSREKVGHSFNVKGVLRELPKGIELWVFTCREDGEDMLYWPQESARIEGNAWFCKVNNVEGGSQRILLFLAGEHGRVLINYFKKAGNENKNWPGITQLTSDIIQCASVEVTVI